MRSALLFTLVAASASASLVKRWDWDELTPTNHIANNVNVSQCVPSCDAATIKRLEDCEDDDDDDGECACSAADYNVLVACANCVIAAGGTDDGDRRDAHEILDNVQRRCGTNLTGTLQSITATGATSGVPTNSATGDSAANPSASVTGGSAAPTSLGSSVSASSPSAPSAGATTAPGSSASHLVPVGGILAAGLAAALVL